MLSYVLQTFGLCISCVSEIAVTMGERSQKYNNFVDVMCEWSPKELLGAIRNGDEISREKLEAILSGGGIGAEAAFRAALLQKVNHATF